MSSNAMLFRTTALALVAAGLMPAAASAQQAEKATSDLTEVVITGSRVIKDGFSAPTPVTVVGVEQLRQAAPSNIGDALNQLPEFRGSQGSTTGGAASSQPNAGYYVNLRGLGTGRTLVLLDGRRVAPSSTTGTTDLNLLPQSLVQRVDVVTGGASAAYGSDAVAGVVNLVLDKKFTGFKGEVQGGISDEDDARSYKVNLTGGLDFLGGRGHLIATVQHTQQDEIANQGEREWASLGVGRFTYTNRTPANELIGQVNQYNAFGGVIVSAGALRNIQFGPGGVPRPFDPGVVNNNQNQIGGDGSRALPGLSAYVRVDNLYAHASFDVTDRVSVYAEANYAESRNRYHQSFNQSRSGTEITIFSGNPFLPASVQQTMTAGAIASFQMRRMHNDQGGIVGDFLNDTLDFTAGFDADLGHDWKLAGYYERGQNRTSQHTRNDMVFERMVAATDAVRDPTTGQTVCRVNLITPNVANNPNAAVRRLAGCVPFNPFGVGAPSQAALDYVFPTAFFRYRTVQEVAEFSVRGDPFSTWAGPVSVAFGANYRKESVTQVSDGVSTQVNFNFADPAGGAGPTAASLGLRGIPSSVNGTQGGWFFTNQTPLDGSYNIKEAFAEAAIPLARDLAWARTLDLNGAFRLTDYSTSGRVETWKLGLTWQPIQDLRLRASRSRDIRAANLSELFAGNIQGGTSVTDFKFPGQVFFPIGTRTGNPALKPEKADTTTLGFVYQPAWLPRFSVSVDYFGISMRDAIGSLTAQETVNQCAAGSSVACDQLLRDPATGFLQRVFTPALNLSKLKTSGVDFEVDYGFDLSVLSEKASGDLSFRLLLSYLDKYVTQAPGGVAIDQVGGVGLVNNPKWKGALSATYSNGPFGLFIQERWIDKGNNDPNLVEGVTIVDNDIPGRLYTDITARYRFDVSGAKLEAFVTINNLFDQAPPRLPTISAGSWSQTNVSLYDVLGRYYTTGLRFRF